MLHFLMICLLLAFIPPIARILGQNLIYTKTLSLSSDPRIRQRMHARKFDETVEKVEEVVTINSVVLLPMMILAALNLIFGWYFIAISDISDLHLGIVSLFTAGALMIGWKRRPIPDWFVKWLKDLNTTANSVTETEIEKLDEMITLLFDEIKKLEAAESTPEIENQIIERRALLSMLEELRDDLEEEELQ